MKESYVFLHIYYCLWYEIPVSIKKRTMFEKKPTKKYEENQVFLNSTLFNLKSQNF